MAVSILKTRLNSFIERARKYSAIEKLDKIGQNWWSGKFDEIENLTNLKRRNWKFDEIENLTKLKIWRNWKFDEIGHNWKLGQNGKTNWHNFDRIDKNWRIW